MASHTANERHDGAVVVGSGPAGVAAAMALRASGVRVLMLDAGNDLAPERREVVERMSGQEPAEWSSDDRATITEGMTATASGVPLKLLYGSDHPWRGAKEWIGLDSQGAEILPSMGIGGLSSVWGAAMLPYRADEMDGWPFPASDLEPHYRAVLGSVPLSGERDGIEAILPLYTDNPGDLKLSNQATALLADLEAAREKLHAAGVRFGRSRVAVRADGCRYCGMCLYGCPYGIIYNSESTFRRELCGDEFSYRPGVVVDRFEETGGLIRVHGYEPASGADVAIDADRAFLGAGPLASARILLRSLEAYDRPLTLRDSILTVTPLLRKKGARGCPTEPLHTLPQLFLEIEDPAISKHSVHVQVYTYNDLYATALGSMFGPLRRPLRPLIDALLSRLLITFSYLHSDDSHGIDVRLVKGGTGREGLSLVLRGVENPRTKPAAKKVQRKLLGLRGCTGAYPLLPMMKVSLAGRGYHTGGTFPMVERPSGFQSDVIGRPAGFSRLHVVDATVFPTIPSTTITLPIMANAHRIGTLAAEVG